MFDTWWKLILWGVMLQVAAAITLIVGFGDIISGAVGLIGALFLALGGLWAGADLLDWLGNRRRG